MLVLVRPGPGTQRDVAGDRSVYAHQTLDQDSWSDASERLEMACERAPNSGQRVAVLIDTRSPESLCEDVGLMVTSRPNHTDEEAGLIGIVAENWKRAPRSRARAAR